MINYWHCHICGYVCSRTSLAKTHWEKHGWFEKLLFRLGKRMPCKCTDGMET